MSKIIKSDTVFSTPWFNIEEKTINGLKSPYYALKLLDYVSILALTNENQVLLVRQFRPAVNEDTLELPSGHVEEAETPEEAACRELLEETGYEAKSLELLGVLNPDVGRLSNKLWCFLGSNVSKLKDAVVEDGIEVCSYSVDQLMNLIQEGKFNHAPNISVLFLAMLKGDLKAP